ncbi:DUF6338 family protein [Actinokineospora sp.]|uniref:DUF6338 family protein n=1 Tax=Actinokineospora sp. TaxID=1872133 RepID=UPI004037C441
MVPVSILGVVVFLLFVAPGSCLELLRGRKALPREESTFVHISRILLSGTFISAATVALLALASLVNPSGVLDLQKLLTQGAAYVSAHLGLVGWTVGVQVVLSSLLATVVSDLRNGRSATQILQADVWHGLGELALQPGQQAFVSVHLKSGRDVIGYYVGASTELEPAKRELILGAPLSVRAAEQAQTVALGPAWERMAISGAEIESVAFCHVSETAPSDPTWWAIKWAWVQRNYLRWEIAIAAIVVVLGIVVLV